MIAASDPQEFVPRGRQQIARHPGPLEPIFFDKGCNDYYLETGLEKVSLSEDCSDEFWILRKAPKDFNKSNKEDSSQKCNNFSKTHQEISMSKSHTTDCGDFFEDSDSFKVSSNCSIHQKVLGKRPSDASIRFPNKRLSCEIADKKNERRNSGDLNKSHVPLFNKTEPSTIKSKISPGFMEDELYIKGCTAVWSRGLINNDDFCDNGRKVITCYTVPAPIRQALWSTFYCLRPTFEPNEAEIYSKNYEPLGVPTPAICLVDSHNIRVFIIKGEQYVIPVHFQIRKVWNTKFGILIEKSGETQLDKLTEEKSGTLFSLSYPLDDICPVAVSHNSTFTRLCSTNNVVVFTSNSPSLCMVFNTNTKEHSVYIIRKVRCDEKDYGESSFEGNSIAHSSSKLKSRLSMWDNLMTSGQLATPRPITAKGQNPVDKQLNPCKSRSFSSMASISRCQSPATTDSPWISRSLKKDTLGKNIASEKASMANSFFNCSKTMSHLMTNPKICLEYVWTDTSSVQDTVTGCPATSVFLSEDLIGQWYLCYVLPSKFQLSVVKVDFSGPSIAFGMLNSISAKDAINIPHLHMMAILEHSGNVTLYSGLTMVGKLHIGGTLLQHTPSPYVRRHIPSPFPRRSSLLPLSKQSEPRFDEHLFSPVLPATEQKRVILPSVNRSHGSARYNYHSKITQKSVLIGLMDSLENRLTLKYSDGTFYRITLPLITHSSLVKHCLIALRQCLPKDAAIVLACRWYSTRNVPGTEDIDNRQEWEMFTGLLFELFGYEDDHLLDKAETPAEKKQKTSLLSTDEDWLTLSNKLHKKVSDPLSLLLQIPFSLNQLPGNKQETSSNISVNPKGILFPFIRYVQFTLHLLYEDFKLNTLHTECLLSLARLLNKLANDLGLKEYSLHYWKDFPKDITIGGPKIDESLFKFINICRELNDRPVSVMDHVFKLLRNDIVTPYPYFANVNVRSRDIVQLCGVLSHANKGIPSEIMLNSFILQEPTQAVHQRSVLINNSHSATIEQVVLLMVEMKIDTRYIETLPIGLYFLLYNALWKCRENPPTDWPLEAYHLLWRDDLVAQAQKIEMEKDKLFQEKMNICFQLQETMPSTKQEIADLDGMEDIDCSLTKMRFSEDTRVMEARKMLASSKPVMITLTQKPEVSDHDFIEEQEKHLYGICIRTMALPVGRGMITLRTATPIITEPLAAPSLCLTGKAPPRGNTIELNHIDTPANMNLWPLFHNGVANGLRITPDAQNIDNTWIIFNKPKGGAEQTMEHAGFLMALGLNGHLRNLAVINTFSYIGKSRHEMTSVGILLGMAAAWRETCDHSLTKILAIHVEALLPPTSMELDVSQNLQVAGLLGIGLLYQKSAHRHITEVLLSEIGRPPGPEMENSVDRESYSLSAGLALGLVMLKHGDQPSGMSDLRVPDTLYYYMVGGTKRPLTGAQKDKYKTASFQIREGSSVNLDVTAPGATLALGLMYLGTGNKAVADWMAAPHTQYLLDFVRPDFLMLRSLSRALILWDSIEPTRDWVVGEVPATIRPYCMVTPSNDADIDYEAMNQAYCNIVAGACFALGLKFAGSADQDACETLLYFCHMFTSLTNKSIADLAGKATIETCLNVLLLSASMVMAGTGNLEVMRLVRHLRRRVGVSNSAIVTYGSHLAIHMALGLLFLGGGRYTLSNSPASVAALICAFYPKFPTHSNDNRYHLQAFRHLYVLAVEPRLVIPKDVLYDDICYAKLRVVKLSGDEITIKAPGLIPDVNSLARVMVDDERYWPVVFERGRNWDLLTKILSTTGYIEVKQRAGCLSYLSDKFGYHSELARTLTHSKVVPWDPPFSSIVNFTSEESIKKFCECVLNLDKSKASITEQRVVQLLTRTTYDAVVKDKLMVIVVMIALVKLIINLESQPNSIGLWQLKIIMEQVFTRSSSPNLIVKETIQALQQEVVSILESHEDKLKHNLKKYIKGEEFDTSVDILASYITFFDIPNNMFIPAEKGDFFERTANLKPNFSSIAAFSKVVKTFEAL
ncbi:anaphase-promoting complex subunit 1 [Anthonomus grandis grandis]|uniref:anaphase-promoting complex subunit 1 n=1 Tax=Anthonomus grandis grandis TaxID=2921223 RepID=UPI002165F6B2|nr:anaphase-promoting complex subunit 1 [Anthonomus grandis grandis]